jgi:hypothetical protein
MGGISGHLNHLYDNRDLTYDDIADILMKASAGELVGTEKTDGFNIFLGYVNGEPRAARNKGDMAKGGMTSDDLLARKFQGGEKARRAYVEAFNAYAKAVRTLSEKEIASVFGEDGEIFYNAEIQGPVAKNVINYDSNVINVHRMGHKRYNHDTGTLEVVDNKKESEALDSLIDRFESILATEPFNVRRTAFLELNKITDERIVDETLSRIQATGLAGDVTIEDLLERELQRHIKTYVSELDIDKQQLVVERILKKEGYLSLNQIGKGLSRDIKDKITLFVNEEAPDLIKEKVWPIEAAIHDFSVELLRGLHSTYVLDNEHEVEKLKSEVEDAIRSIQSYDGPYKEEAHDILAKQLEKLKHHDNIDTVVEGFAFQYCHKGGDCAMYKFTGNFAPVNQLLGLFKYGRGKMPPLNLNEQNERIEKVIAIYPGRFQPMGQHHAETFRKIQDERGYDNSFITTANPEKPDGRNPFDFSDKQMIATQYDIPASKVIMAINPYQAAEVLDSFDPKTTAVIYYVGAKDIVSRFPHLGGLKSDGAPRYFREYDKGEDLKGWGEHGYIAVSPHVSIDIPEVGEMSGTNLRYALENADEEAFQQIMGFYDPEIYDIIKDKLKTNSLEEAQYYLGIFRGLMEEVVKETAGSFEFGLSNPPYTGTRRVSGDPEEEDDEELEEIAAMSAGAVTGHSGKKEEEDEIVNEFYNYLLNNLEG